ncbi:MAG: PadR family transcriptional regulator [Anaerolineales bacterium]|jgi:DNA-binding PadR family transcriptional regulator
MTKAELAILGLVAEKPRHGYEIESVIEARGMRDWTEIGFSSIYYLLKKLEEKGLVSSQLEKASGRGPARKVFHVTDEGRRVWYQETLNALTIPERSPTPLLLGMSAILIFPPEQAIQALVEYQEKLSEDRDRVKGNWDRQSSGVPLPYFVDAMFDYSVTLIEAEIEWIEGFIQRIRDNT